MTVFRVEETGGRVITTAIHAGHDVRDDVRRQLAIGEPERLREEDPLTEVIADIGVTRVVVERSRFEVDMNRPRETCVYRGPADAWGLDVWRKGCPNSSTIEESLLEHDRFYAGMRDLFARRVSVGHGFVALDVHSYNHRRGGPDAPEDDPVRNPDVNLGTRTLDRVKWAPVIDVFLEYMRDMGFEVGENVKFGGGAFAAWANHEFAENGCVLAVEFKKTFMDEWTGHPDMAAVQHRRSALKGVAPLLADALGRVAAEGASA